jgi:hypothetical protein
MAESRIRDARDRAQTASSNFRREFQRTIPRVKTRNCRRAKSELSVSPAEATIETSDSVEQSLAPETNESGDDESATTSENASLSVSPEESAAVVEGKRDEFLGFRRIGRIVRRRAGSGQSALRRQQPRTTIAQADDETRRRTSKPENQSSSKYRIRRIKSPIPPINLRRRHRRIRLLQKRRRPLPLPREQADNRRQQRRAREKRRERVRRTNEPFEFEKCTINLNLTLLPMESGKNTRKVIVGATSHNLPPEIEFLDITESGDLTQIAELVSEKLARFKQTLPVKYIEQLRASKAKSVKKTAQAKATTAATAAPTESANNQANATKTSGEQKAPETKRAETEKPQSEAATEKNNTAASTAPLPIVNQSGARNNIQGSLF